MWDKLYEFAYDATVGLAKLYQQKTMELVKLTAASAYLQILKVLRKHLVLLFAAFFAVILTAVAAVALPVAAVIVTDWNGSTKLAVLGILALFYVSVCVFCLRQIFSQKKWMKSSGIQELLDSLHK